MGTEQYMIRFPDKANTSEEHCIECLVLALEKFHVPSGRYSFDGIIDGAVCLHKQEKWKVTYSTRGKKDTVSEHEDLYSACLAFIDAVSDDDEDARNIKRYFEDKRSL